MCVYTHMHTMEYYSAIQKSYKNFVICSNIDGLGGHNAQRKTSNSMISLICRIEKIQRTSEYNKKETDSQNIEQTSDYQLGGGGTI